LQEILPPIERHLANDLEKGRHLEWLATNGRGGYAMATIHQQLARRYHGLLVAGLNPGDDRYVLLAKLDATASMDGLTYELATNDYPEAVHPQGYKLLESFAAWPYPTWRWRVGSMVIEQTLCMVEGEDTTFVRYRLVEGNGRLDLILRPLCTSRRHHHVSRYADVGPPNVETGDDTLVFHWAGDRPDWQLAHNGMYRARADWYYHFALAVDAERGYDEHQDLFMPGIIRRTLSRDDATGLVVAASRHKRTWSDWSQVFDSAEQRARAPRPDRQAPVEDPFVDALSVAALDYLVDREDTGRSVVAGYPWFGDWGRDTFISLPGLCLVTGLWEDARRIITTFAGYVKDGLIPNYIPGDGRECAYNTSDATLWYLHAIDRYIAYSGDAAILDRIYPTIVDILEHHERGTRFGIGVADDGLLAQGEPGKALTWMDAKLPDRAVTPRIGKAVGVNALWYNALRVALSFAHQRGDDATARRWSELAERCRQSFNARFWNDAKQCLFDVVDVDHQVAQNDVAIRPNQLFAISLTHAVLDEARWASVVGVCERHLWTPMGLRTLSPADDRYIGKYAGDVVQRDAAYHQGTVWPWLLGPFVAAYVRVHGDGPAVLKTARGFLAGLEPHLNEAGIGGISEVADGDAPHLPGGCPWQAWSVAEPLRALLEDVHRMQPTVRSRTAAAAVRQGAK